MVIEENFQMLRKQTFGEAFQEVGNHQGQQSKLSSYDKDFWLGLRSLHLIPVANLYPGWRLNIKM